MIVEIIFKQANHLIQVHKLIHLRTKMQDGVGGVDLITTFYGTREGDVIKIQTSISSTTEPRTCYFYIGVGLEEEPE